MFWSAVCSLLRTEGFFWSWIRPFWETFLSPPKIKIPSEVKNVSLQKKINRYAIIWKKHVLTQKQPSLLPKQPDTKEKTKRKTKALGGERVAQVRVVLWIWDDSRTKPGSVTRSCEKWRIFFEKVFMPWLPENFLEAILEDVIIDAYDNFFEKLPDK